MIGIPRYYKIKLHISFVVKITPPQNVLFIPFQNLKLNISQAFKTVSFMKWGKSYPRYIDINKEYEVSSLKHSNPRSRQTTPQLFYIDCFSLNKIKKISRIKKSLE